MIRVAWWLCVGLAVTTGVFNLCQSFLPEAHELFYECLDYGLILIPVALYARRRYGLSWLDLFPIRGTSWRLVPPILITSLGMLLIGAQLITLCRNFAIVSPEGVDALTGEPLSEPEPPPSSFLAGLAALSVVPAIAEEALVRGLLLQSLLPAMSARRAIAFSAFLFAALHLRIERMPDTFMGGLFYGWLFVRTGSLLPSMIAHAFNNAVVLLLNFAEPAGEMPDWLGPDQYGFLSLSVTLVAAAVTCVGLVWIWLELRRARARAEQRGEKPQEPLGYAA